MRYATRSSRRCRSRVVDQAVTRRAARRRAGVLQRRRPRRVRHRARSGDGSSDPPAAQRRSAAARPGRSRHRPPPRRLHRRGYRAAGLRRPGRSPLADTRIGAARDRHGTRARRGRHGEHRAPDRALAYRLAGADRRRTSSSRMPCSGGWSTRSRDDCDAARRADWLESGVARSAVSSRPGARRRRPASGRRRSNGGRRRGGIRYASTAPSCWPNGRPSPVRARRAASRSAAPAGCCQLRDGWVAVSLPRPSDLELVEALTEGTAADPWDGATRVGRGAHRRRRSSSARALARARAQSASARARAPLQLPAERVRGGRARLAPLVVDFSALWAGPLCSSLLGLAGARVVKVESVGRPDGARRGEPRFYDLLHAGHEILCVRPGAGGGSGSGWRALVRERRRRHRGLASARARRVGAVRTRGGRPRRRGVGEHHGYGRATVTGSASVTTWPPAPDWSAGSDGEPVLRRRRHRRPADRAGRRRSP